MHHSYSTRMESRGLARSGISSKGHATVLVTPAVMTTSGQPFLPFILSVQLSLLTRLHHLVNLHSGKACGWDQGEGDGSGEERAGYLHPGPRCWCSIQTVHVGLLLPFSRDYKSCFILTYDDHVKKTKRRENVPLLLE